MNPVGSLKKRFIELAFVGSCLLPLNSPAIDLKQSKFTQVVNSVKIISTADKSSHSANVNDTFKMPDVLRTGADSRAELVAADDTITRVGANTIFSYDTENRTIDLQQGSLLFHSPHGNGGGTIRTAAAVAAVVGTTIIVSCTPDGGFKVLDLEGEVDLRFTNGRRLVLEPGQMAFVLPGGQYSPVIVFRLDSQIKGSLLVSGFDQPLPSMPRIDAEVTRQLIQILNNQATDTGLLAGDRSSSSQVQTLVEIAARSLGSPELLLNHQHISSSADVNVGSASANLNVTVGNSTIDSSAGSVGVNASGDINVGNTSVNASGDVNLNTSGDINVSGSTSLSAGNDVNLNTSGDVNVGSGTVSALANVSIAGVNVNIGATLVQGPTITVNADDGILIDSATLTGDTLNLTGGKGNLLGGPTANIQNTDLTTFSVINIAAHTVNLENVAFANGSTVNLQSFFGALAPLPNTGLPSLPGYVNFISGVTYGGSAAQNHVNPGSGPGIYISAQH
jgi:hypothetical protein